MAVGVDGQLVAIGGIEFVEGTTVPSATVAESTSIPTGLRFAAHNTATATAAGTPLGAPIDTAVFNPDGLTVAGGEVAVPEGVWLVEADVTLQGTSSSRTNFDCWLSVDGVQAAGSLGMLYLRQANYGATAHLSTVVTVGAGLASDVGVTVSRTNGTSGGLFIVGGSRVAVHRLA